MYYIQNKRYYLIKDNDRQIYAVNKEGYIQIYIHSLAENIDTLWVKGQYCDLRFISKTDFVEDCNYYYVILKSLDGEGHVIDLISNKTVLENFRYAHFDGHYKYVTIENEKIITHILLRFNNTEKRQYSVYSMSAEKIIIGPIKYESIEICRNGVILDKSYVIENNGYSFDLSEYTLSEKSNVYFNKKEGLFLIRFDYEGALFHSLHKSKRKGILTTRIQYTDYYYNVAEDKLMKKSPSTSYAGWTKRELEEAADIAYEGHSRLELGLE